MKLSSANFFSFQPYIFIILGVIISCTGTKQSASDAPPFRVVGYYSLTAALTANINAVPYEKLTHINLWFLNPDSLGNYNRNLYSLQPFIDEAHRQNVKVLFSIGGGGNYPHYSQLLREENKTHLINNLVSEVLKYNLDGVDVDLEGGAIDENYEDFVVELARELRKHDKKITAAIAVYYKDQFTDKALGQYDFVNIMVYDRTGPWRPNQPGHHSTFNDAVEDLEYFGIERNIPAEKMVLGVPFYGYAFSRIPDLPVLTMNYNEIVERFSGSQYADEWDFSDEYTIYYNGIPTIVEKTNLAKEKASGIMIWQLLGDAPGEESLLQTINEAAFPK